MIEQPDSAVYQLATPLSNVDTLTTSYLGDDCTAYFNTNVIGNYRYSKCAVWHNVALPKTASEDQMCVALYSNAVSGDQVDIKIILDTSHLTHSAIHPVQDLSIR